MCKKAILILALLVSLPMTGLSMTPRTVTAMTGSIFTSQIGFVPNDTKSAVLAVPRGTAVDLTFRVLDAGGAVSYASQPGDVRFYANGWYGNNSTGDTYLLDFSRWTPPAAGRYLIESNGLRSLPFEVSANVYDVRRVKPLEFFRIQQAGITTTVSWVSLDGTTGGHGPDHQDDARQATRRDKGGGDRSLIEQDYLTLPNGHLPVAGGWFDAGDYNEYMGNTPWAAYLLLLSYEEYNAYWASVDNNGNGQPDLLEYVKPALEWMLSMRHSDGLVYDGSVYERVFNGYAAPFDGRPDLETDNVWGNADDRPLDTDRYADITVKSAYAMATAYRVFHDQRYLDMAVAAWDWAYANQGTVKPQRYGGGLYFGDVEIGLTLGALELHRAILAAGRTPDTKYLNYASAHIQSHLGQPTNNWINPSTWDYQQSYTLIRYYDLAPEDTKALILQSLRDRWNAGIGRQAQNPYQLNDEWLYANFGQNDLMASSAGDALWLFGKTGQREYYDYAVNQMAWIFGRNPFGESWLASSLVSEYTRIPHWRVTARHPIEGVVVPGANDQDGNRIPDYTDTGDYYYSEPTINQQAMFVRVMTMLNQAAGGNSGPPPPADLPPTVSIINPTAGAVVNGTVQIEASAADDQGVTAVAYQMDSGSPVDMSLVSGTAKSGTWRAAWNTASVPDGSHVIMVVAKDTVGQQSSASATVKVNNGGSPTMHVERIDLELVFKGNSTKIQAKSDTYIFDAFGSPVAGATVTGHWEGSATDTFSGTTDTSGKVTDYSNSANMAGGVRFTWVVDKVEKSGWIYDQPLSKPTRTVTWP